MLQKSKHDPFVEHKAQPIIVLKVQRYIHTTCSKTCQWSLVLQYVCTYVPMYAYAYRYFHEWKNRPKVTRIQALILTTFRQYLIFFPLWLSLAKSSYICIYYVAILGRYLDIVGCFLGPNRLVTPLPDVFCRPDFLLLSPGWPDWANFHQLGDCLCTLGSRFKNDKRNPTFLKARYFRQRQKLRLVLTE
jgi:hypothetical protein